MKTFLTTLLRRLQPFAHCKISRWPLCEKKDNQPSPPPKSLPRTASLALFQLGHEVPFSSFRRSTAYPLVPCTIAHFRTSRWPPRAASSHVCSFHWFIPVVPNTGDIKQVHVVQRRYGVRFMPTPTWEQHMLEHPAHHLLQFCCRSCCCIEQVSLARASPACSSRLRPLEARTLETTPHVPRHLLQSALGPEHAVSRTPVEPQRRRPPIGEQQA